MEKIIQLILGLDTETQKTFYLGLTSTGRIFTTHDLKKWRLKKLPNFEDLKVTEEETKLNG